MNKKLVPIVAGTLLLLTGCSNAKTNESAKAPSTNEIVSKSVAAQKKQKNLHLGIDTIIKAEGESMKMTIESDFSIKPIRMLGEYGMSGDGNDTIFNVYLDKDKFYMKSKNGSWQDISSESSSSGLDVKALQKQVDGSQASDFPDSLKKTAKVTDKNGKYKILMSAKGKEVEKIIKRGNSQLKLPTSDVDDLNIKSINYTYIIDKKTFLPDQLDMIIKMKYEDNSFEEAIISKFSGWNKSEVKEPQLGK